MDCRDLAVDLVRSLSTFPEIFVYRQIVDFRKSIDGLSSIIASDLKLKPFSGGLFVFMGRRRDRIKILYWDKTGFAIWYKRLEEAKFPWPRGEIVSDLVLMSPEQLEWLLSGVDVWKIKTHPVLNYENIG